MERYVPRAEVEARIQELQQQDKLWTEAKEEIKQDWS
jgi:hypothetical protein